MTPRELRKQEVKLAVLRSLAENGHGPDALLKMAEDRLAKLVEYGALGATIGIPAMLAYNLQRLRNTAKSDMKSALDVESIAAYRRAAEEAKAIRASTQAQLPKPKKVEEQEPAPVAASAAGGLPW